MESTILKKILLSLSTYRNARFFRNNTGRGWQGVFKNVGAGNVLLTDARPLDAGLCRGSSDLIGWVTVEIRPEWIGRKVAVFAAIEGKTELGKVSTEQQNFIDNVKNAGGVAGVARCESDAKNLIEKFEPILST